MHALDYTKGLPLTNSVTARAIRPIIAKRPFQFSAEEEKTSFDFESADTPLNMGMREAAVKRAAVMINH